MLFYLTIIHVKTFSEKARSKKKEDADLIEYFIHIRYPQNLIYTLLYYETMMLK